MKKYTLQEVEDKLIGELGTKEREQYEFELKMDLIGDMIKRVRKEKQLTQEQLGELVGVQKAQISRLENKTGNVTIETLQRVFEALGAHITMNVRFS